MLAIPTRFMPYDLPGATIVSARLPFGLFPSSWHPSIIMFVLPLSYYHIVNTHIPFAILFIANSSSGRYL